MSKRKVSLVTMVLSLIAATTLVAAYFLAPVPGGITVFQIAGSEGTAKEGEKHGGSMSGRLMLRDGEGEQETGSGIMSETRRPWVIQGEREVWNGDVL